MDNLRPHHDFQGRTEQVQYASPALPSPAAPGTFSLVTQRVVGAGWPESKRWEEILLRPTNGESAAALLSRARRDGQGRQIDSSVISQGFAWLASRPDVGRISLNTTTDSLHHSACVDGWLASMDAWGIAPERVCIELPEHLPPTSNTRVVAIVEKLHAAGLTIALDDVGEDGSLLRWCDTGLISVMKIDRRVLRDDLARPVARMRLLDGLAALADQLDIELVIEGVETEAGAARVAGLGRNVNAQGYFIAAPLPCRMPAQRGDVR